MTFHYFLISPIRLVGSIHFSYLRLLQWYLWRCPPSYKHQSLSSAWSSAHTEVPAAMFGPWTSCSCSPCCLAPTRTSPSFPSTSAVAPTSQPTGVTHFKTRFDSAFMFFYNWTNFLVKVMKLGCNKEKPQHTGLFWSGNGSCWTRET